MPDDVEYITVGTLGRSRGVRGEIYVTPLTDFPDRFLDLEEIFVEVKGRWERRVIAESKIISGRPVLRFDGVTSPEDASRMTNYRLAVRRADVRPLPEGSYYVFDLVGCEVFEDGTDRLLGEITDVRQYPANDAWEIRTISGKKVLFPAIRQYVKSVDIPAGRVVVSSAGLLDEAAEDES